MKTKYDWSNVDKNVKFIAVDADGVIGGYSERPYKNKGAVWLCNESHPDSWVCNMYPFEYYPNNNCPDWQDSLEERPNEN